MTFNHNMLNSSNKNKNINPQNDQTSDPGTQHREKQIRISTQTVT